MNVSYQNANYNSGNQSTLFSFEFDQEGHRYGILIDSGPGLDLDQVLEDNEYLSATLLTHAHQDHIASLDECLRDGATIYASQQTVTILEQMLAVDAEHLGISNADAVKENLEPLESGWTQITGDIEVHPVPVGHAPGAIGFLIRFADEQHMFVTGDFTLQDVAGNPGFDPTFGGTLHPNTKGMMADAELGETVEGLNIDALHLNGSTRENATQEIQKAVGTIYDRVTSGSATVVTTSSLGGIHIAGLLDALQQAQDDQFKIVLTGKIATVYDALSYEFDHVSTVPTFEDGSTLLTPGQVTIAGPEDASAGSAKRLLEAANRKEGNTTVVQLRSAGTAAIKKPWITTYDFTYSLHPSKSEIDEVVETIDPVELLISHTTNEDVFDRWKDRGPELETFVWASYGQHRYDLFNNGGWLPPRWLDESFANRVLTHAEYQSRNSVTAEELPQVELRPITLEDENISFEALANDSTSLRDLGSTTETDAGGVSIELDASLVHLGQLAVDGETRIAHEEIETTTVDTLIMTALDWFISESLRDAAPKQTTGAVLEAAVAIEETGLLARILDAESPEDRNPKTALVDAVRTQLDLPNEETVSYTNPALAPRLSYVQALIDNDATEFEQPDDVVQAALESALGI